MRVLFVTENDPIYIYDFFKTLIKHHNKSKFEIVGVTILNAFNESLLNTGIRILKLYNIKFYKILFKFLLVKLKKQSISNLLLNNGYSVIPSESVNSREYIDKIRKLDLDLIISVASPEIFKSKLISVPKICSLNIHNGKIPKYRGMLPSFWQMYYEEKYITITIHKIVEKLDSGDIYKTKLYPIEKNKSLDEVMTETKKEGAKLMLESIYSIAKNPMEINFKPIDLSESDLHKFPGIKDSIRFRKKGLKLI